MALEGECLLPGLRVPHLHRTVTTGARQARAVGTEAHRGDAEGVPLERTSRPVRASHTFTSPGLKRSTAQASLVPSGLKHTAFTTSECPLSERYSCPVRASHTFTVLLSVAI